MHLSTLQVRKQYPRGRAGQVALMLESTAKHIVLSKGIHCIERHNLMRHSLRRALQVDKGGPGGRREELLR